MKALPLLILPTILGAAFLWLQIYTSEASSMMNALLTGSLVLSVPLTAWLMRFLPQHPLILPFACCFTLYFILSLLQSSSEEGYIQLTQRQYGSEQRYIYPGHSGMGYADGLIHYTRCLPSVLIASTIVGLLNIAVIQAVRKTNKTVKEKMSL